MIQSSDISFHLILNFSCSSPSAPHFIVIKLFGAVFAAHRDALEPFFFSHSDDDHDGYSFRSVDVAKCADAVMHESCLVSRRRLLLFIRSRDDDFNGTDEKGAAEESEKKRLRGGRGIQEMKREDAEDAKQQNGESSKI